MEVRLATEADADAAGQLLWDFNREYDTPAPEPAVLAARLRPLLAGSTTFAVLAGSPPLAIALVTLRTSVWYPGGVALLEELYVAPARRNQRIGSAVIDRVLAECRARGVELVEINVDEPDVDAQRFYERHGFGATEPGGDERALFYWQELASD